MMNRLEESIKYGRLLGKYLKRELTTAEQEELDAWIRQDKANKDLLLQLSDDHRLAEEIKRFEEPDAALAWQKLLGAMQPKTRIKRMPYRRVWSVVACVLLAFSVLAWWYFSSNKTEIPGSIAREQVPVKDVMPGGEKAILTLGDGSRIVLDSAANGVLAVQGGATVTKLKTGELAYAAHGAALSANILYNTVATPRGGQYRLTLPDGSKVWLNAGSSIKFPSTFTGDSRTVEVTGETYFEVAKNPEIPFRVTFNTSWGGSGEIEVLGTHFNVNAYTDEPLVNTTLLEGAIKIKSMGDLRNLSPGQQVRADAKGMRLYSNVELEQVVSWKDGFFWFDNTDIRTLMRQIARWYDVEVVFDGKPTTDGFSGKISKSLPLTKLLYILKLNDIRIEGNGKRVIIKS
ncbi:FecR family protein [Niabella aurantiaca]|uniref:FecR family protein n=1 Tax=Niabella aurantiaca TaxID=379900 RepID=UPI00039B01C6|nr:FecR family protein [Niabella aurantiaca]